MKSYLEIAFYLSMIFWIVGDEDVSIANVSRHQGSGLVCYFSGHAQCSSIDLLDFVLAASQFHLLPIGVVL